MSIQELIEKVKTYNSDADTALIQKAYEFSLAAHLDEKRFNGETVADHSLSVAYLLTELKVDEETVSAGLLHDVLEKTNIMKKDLEEEFGSTVSNLVDGVTVVKKVKTKTGEYGQFDNIRKLFLTTAKDVRVVLIRLAEKLDNLEKIDALPESYRADSAQKGLDIYAPLAERLGVHHFSWQIEDEAFKFLQPEAYKIIRDILAKTRAERENYVSKVIQILSNSLKDQNIEAEVFGRPKHYYSIYKKYLSERTPDESLENYWLRLHDVHAFRVVVANTEDCYKTLDLIHSLWPPQRPVRDYIAKPKPNGYRSIHTAVLCEDGLNTEFQIRTQEMHEYNEFGPASHLYYKELGRDKGSLKEAPVDRLAWLKSLVEWQTDLSSEEDFETALKIDLFGDRVFALTPKGDVFDLPRGSTPIDFAYQIHSQVGDSCVGAKVDGRMVPLNYELQNNQVVEIIRVKNKHKPSRDWLEFVKTQEARSRIRRALQTVE